MNSNLSNFMLTKPEVLELLFNNTLHTRDPLLYKPLNVESIHVIRKSRLKVYGK